MYVVGLASLNKVDEEAGVQVARLHSAADHFAAHRLQLPRQSDLPPAAMEQLWMEAYEALAPEEAAVSPPVWVPQVLPTMRLQEQSAKQLVLRREGGLAMAEAVMKGLWGVEVGGGPGRDAQRFAIVELLGDRRRVEAGCRAAGQVAVFAGGEQCRGLRANASGRFGRQARAPVEGCGHWRDGNGLGSAALLGYLCRDPFGRVFPSR